MVQVNHHLDETMDHADGVRLFIFKRQAFTWAKVRAQCVVAHVARHHRPSAPSTACVYSPTPHLSTDPKERQRAFIDEGANIGEVPYEVWHAKSELGFKKAAVVGYEGSERAKPALDPTRDGPVRVMKLVMAEME